MKKKRNAALVVMVMALVFAAVAGGCDIYNPVIDEWWVGPEGGTPLNYVIPIKFYTITFKSNGGDYIDLVHADLNALDDPPEQKIQAGQKVKEPGLVNGPASSKFTDGWYIDVNGNGIKDPEDSTKWDFNTMTPTSDLTLVANWASTGHTIEFVLNGNIDNAGADEIVPSDTTYYSGTNADGVPLDEFIVDGNILSIPKWFALKDPKANDYVFWDWYKEPTLTTPWNFSDPLTPTDPATIILYAGWGVRGTGNTASPPKGGPSIPLHTVQFVTGVPDNPIDPQTVYSGRTIPEPDAIHNRDGYVFSGWYKDSRFRTPYDFNTPVTGNMTLYAKWEPEPYTFPWFTDKFYTTNDFGMPNPWYPFQCHPGDVNWVEDGSGDPDDTANFNNQMSVVDLLKDNPNAMALIVGFKDTSSDPAGTEAAREESARGEFDDMGVSGQLFKYTDYNPPAGALPSGSVPGTTGTSTDEVRIYVFTPKNQS